MQELTFDNFEKIRSNKPTYRLEYFVKVCKDKNVLDLGSYDETALELKAYSDLWLFSLLEKNAKKVTGIDIALKEDTFNYKSAVILKKDVYAIKGSDFPNIELITAGEILEHLESPLGFLRQIKKEFSGREMVFSTPNGLNFSNTLMGMIKREVQHPDHYSLFSYKVLTTLCSRAGFESWEITPYYFFANEMKLKAKSKLMKGIITLVEKCIRGVEYLFPVLSMGYIVKIKI